MLALRSLIKTSFKGVSPVKCIAYGTLIGASEASQQYMVTPLASGGKLGDQPLEPAPIARCFALGAFWLGPSVMMYQQFAERTFPGAAWRMVGKKILMDQTFLGPIMIASFFIGINLLEGNALKKATTELKEKFLVVYGVGFAFWPLANAFQWRKVPVPKRPLFNAICALFWGNFLCFMKAKEMAKEDVEVTEATEGTEAVD